MNSADAEVIADLAPGGVLRAAINLGNPVLAQGPAAKPAGVTVDIARELGARLGVPAELACFGAARESFEAMARGDADICFLAIEPARAAQVAFTAPVPRAGPGGRRRHQAGGQRLHRPNPGVPDDRCGVHADPAGPGDTRTRAPATLRFLAAFVEDLKASGFIGDALRRSGQDGALVAPPEPRN